MKPAQQVARDRRLRFNAAVMQWWKEMQPAAEEEGQPNRRGELAKLKRCKTLEEVLFDPRFQVLRRMLQEAGYGGEEKLAAIAGVLARIKHDIDVKFPAWLGQPKEGGSPKVGELRFRRLLDCKTLKEAYPLLIRLLPLAGDTAPVASLAHDIYYWNDKTRAQWAFAYYDALAEHTKENQP